MTYQLMMRKADYVVATFSKQCVDVDKTHIGITVAQYRFLLKNPAANGARILRFELTAENMPDSVREQAWADIEAAEAKAAAPVAVAAPVVEQPVTGDAGNPTADSAPATAPSATTDFLATLMAMEDKAAIIAYGEALVGKKITVHQAAGKAKAAQAVIDAMAELSAPAKEAAPTNEQA